MIRHRPAGRGHPYLIEPDQRIPVRPVVGETFEVRATTPADASTATVEVVRDGRLAFVPARRRGPAVPAVATDFGVAAPRVGEGHLSDAVARLGEQRGRCSWAAELPGLAPGERARYRFASGRDRSRWFDLAPATWEPDGGTLSIESDDEAIESRLVPGSVSWLRSGDRAYRLRFAVALEPNERVIGFGERFNGVDQRGKLVDSAVFDQYKGQGARSYLPMPFAIIVGGGFGFHLDTGRRARFDVGVTVTDQLVCEVDLEPGLLHPELRLRLYRGSPAEVTAAFTAETGRPEAPPPDWVYRLWMSGNEWNTQAQVLEEVERSEELGIPVGAIVIEAWSDESTFVAFNGAEAELHPDGSPHSLSDFHFPADGPWPDPKGMVDDLHARDIKVLLWQIPLARIQSGQARADRDTMLERGYCVTLTDGRPYRNRGWWFPGALLPDFTNAEASKWWTEKRRYLLEELGIDGFKTDGGEHAWGTDLRYADGSDGGETNNRYPVLYGEAYGELLRSAGHNPVIFSRAGYTGSGSLPCHWAGDEDSTWEAFRASISAGLSAGACGIFFWGWDIAGFSGPVPAPELYLRATAMAALCPIMQYHSEYNHHRRPSRDRTPWNVAEETGDPGVIAGFRRFVELRERLVPYLAEQGALCVSDGKPLMRALCFEVAGDDRIWGFPEEYFLGDHLVVAPVTHEGAKTWRLYVPAGEWIDPWTGDAIGGPAVVERAAPLDQIPLLVAAARPDLVAAIQATTELRKDA